MCIRDSQSVGKLAEQRKKGPFRILILNGTPPHTSTPLAVIRFPLYAWICKVNGHGGPERGANQWNCVARVHFSQLFRIGKNQNLGPDPVPKSIYRFYTPRNVICLSNVSLPRWIIQANGILGGKTVN